MKVYITPQTIHPDCPECSSSMGRKKIMDKDAV